MFVINNVHVSLNSVSWMMHSERILRAQLDLETLYLCRFVKSRAFSYAFTL